MSNLSGRLIITTKVIVSFLMRHCLRATPRVLALAAGVLAVALGVDAQTHPQVHLSAEASAADASASPASVTSMIPPTVVIGFLGGFVRHDDIAHSEVQLAQRLRSEYPASVRVETFENHRRDEAHRLVLNLVGSNQSGAPIEAGKRAARVILYGHSWGANAVVALARELEADGIPVRLTIQVDSIAKSGQNDAVIPSNVAEAVNFYQDKGLFHGQRQIRAADSSRTQILGNFRMDYDTHPIACPQYPWFSRLFMKSHIEIECDPAVWERIEMLIREQLPSQVTRDSEGGAN